MPASVLMRALTTSDALLARLQPLVLLCTRAAVAIPFINSGLAKLEDLDNTEFLFQEEYRVPLLSPDLAAGLATAGELVFPALLLAGFATRLGALGLGAVNAVAVLAYAHVLLEPGFEAALGQHVLWGFMLLVLLAFGAGTVSVDHWLGRSGRVRAAAAL